MPYVFQMLIKSITKPSLAWFSACDDVGVKPKAKVPGSVSGLAIELWFPLSDPGRSLSHPSPARLCHRRNLGTINAPQPVNNSDQ